MSTGLVRLWNELRRRRVFQVAAIYAAAAWIIVQVVGEVAPALYLPAWVMTAIVVCVILGFPVTVILGWLFDVGPTGVVRTKPGSVTGVTAILISIGLLIAGTAGFVALILPKPQLAQEQVAKASFTPIVNSIAVLPFLNLSADDRFEFFADGMSEVLIHQLSQMAELHVIARTSSFIFKDQKMDAREIGRKLNVGRVLEGSVQRLGDKLRITAQLIDTDTGVHVWSQLFDREEMDYFRIQDEISIAVAEAMQVALSDQQKDRLSAGITEDLDAYELYLLGRQDYMYTTAVGGSPKALDYFQRAIDIDPEFPLALSGLADAYISQGIGGQMDMTEALDKARAAIDKALELDPDLGEAHTSDLVYAMLTGDYDAARAAGRRALELSPSYAMAHHYYGMFLLRQQETTEALRMMERFYTLDPNSTVPTLKYLFSGLVAWFGDYERAIAITQELNREQKGTENEASYAFALSNLALDFGRLDEAVAYANRAIANGLDMSEIRLQLAYAYLLLGDMEKARSHLATAENLFRKEQESNPFSSDAFFEYMKADFLAATNDVEGLIIATRILADAAEANTSIGYMAAVVYAYVDRFDAVARHMEMATVSPNLDTNTLAAFAQLRLGDVEKAQAYLDKAKIFFDSGIEEGATSPYFLRPASEYLVVAGEIDEALAMLENLYESGYRNYAYLNIMPIFDAIHLDPRFLDIVDRMQTDAYRMRERVEFAEKTGDWAAIVASTPD